MTLLYYFIFYIMLPPVA